MKNSDFMKELRKCSDKDLFVALDKFQQGLFTLELNKRTNGVKNTASIKHARKNVARAKTVINEKLKQ